MVTFTGVRGGTQQRPPPSSSPRDTLPKAEEWEENSVGWREKVVVQGRQKLAWRHLIRSMAFADARASHVTEKIYIFNTTTAKSKWNVPQVQSDRLPPRGMRNNIYRPSEAVQTAGSHLQTHSNSSHLSELNVLRLFHQES